MRVARSTDPHDFARRDWTSLVRTHPFGTFFHTPAYLKLYWEEFGDEPPLFLFAEDEEGLCGAVVFEREGSTIRFLGGTEVTDYLGPIGRPGSERAIAAAFLEELDKEPDWLVADLRGLADGSPWIPALVEAARARGNWAQVETDDVTPRIELPTSFDEYLARLPAKLRHELRRKKRKLEAEAGGATLVRSGPDRLEADLDRFVSLHRASEGPKGKFMQPGMEIFFWRLADAFAGDGTFRLSLLDVGGTWGAGAISFAFKDAVSLYNSAFDQGFRALAPGMVLVGELIREAIDEGYGVFDMLKGGLAYKYRFGAVPRPLCRVRIARH